MEPGEVRGAHSPCRCQSTAGALSRQGAEGSLEGMGGCEVHGGQEVLGHGQISCLSLTSPRGTRRAQQGFWKSPSGRKPSLSPSMCLKFPRPWPQFTKELEKNALVFSSADLGDMVLPGGTTASPPGCPQPLLPLHPCPVCPSILVLIQAQCQNQTPLWVRDPQHLHPEVIPRTF